MGSGKKRFKIELEDAEGSRYNLSLEGKFPYGSFTSTDILELYEDQYNEPIKLSIISTYLSRYSERSLLTRTRQGKEWVYKTTRQQPAARMQPPSPSASRDLNQ